MNKKYICFFRKYILSQKREFFLACLVTVLKSLVVVCQPLAYKVMVDKALPAKNFTMFLQFLILMLGCYMAASCFNIWKDYLLAKISEMLCMRLRTELNDKLSRLDYRFFDRNGAGEVLSKYNKEVEIIKDNCGYMLLEIAGNLCTLLLAIIMIAILDWKMLIIFLVIFFIFVQSNHYFGKKVQEQAEKSMNCNKVTTADFTENFNNVLITKLYALYNKVNEKFKAKYEKQYRTNVKLELVYSMNINISAFWIYILSALIWLIGGIGVCIGKTTLGTVLTLANYQGVMISPVNFFCQFNNGYQETCIAINRISEIFEFEEEDYTMNPCYENSEIEEIDFSHISFQYLNRGEVLYDVNLHMKRGEIYAFIGESGCGKSTIAKLLVGLYPPDTGEIRVNQVPSHMLGVEYLRKRIGYVPQDSLFFEDTIINNVLLDIQIEQGIVEEKSKKIDLSDEIENMAGGWNTVLNFGTTNISGGQKKRIDLLRVFLRKFDVLIFDESTASLDVDRRKLLFEYIDTIKKEKIIIFITHNMEECEHFDTIFTIADKRIVTVQKENMKKDYKIVDNRKTNY